MAQLLYAAYFRKHEVLKPLSEAEGNVGYQGSNKKGKGEKLFFNFNSLSC